MRSIRSKAFSVAVAAAAVCSASVAIAQATPDRLPASRGAALSPQIVHTGRAPTGYTVTFRFRDPSATRVQLKGEWYFGNPYELSELAGTSASDVVQTPGLLPTQWRPGDIPLPYPNSNAANWPVIDMTKDGHTGVWSFTTPLPSGVFSYGFYVNCADPAQTGCTEVADPSNPAWNVHGSKVDGSVEPVSQVYVPSDPRFQSQDLSWQAPSDRRGALTDVTYPAPTSLTPAGENYLGVYTPPGYDPHRTQPYPTVYMFAPDDEVAWTTQGDLANILDNLIDTGEIQPMVVVTPNVQGFPAATDSSTFDADLTNSIIPFVESHYNVATSAAQRAAGGLGYGASIVNSLLFDHTGEFGFYGAFAPGIKGPYTLPTAQTLTTDQVAALKRVSISIGGGLQDPSHWYHASEVALLTSAGVPVYPDFVNGGHNWYSWRLNARDFLTHVAFFPAPAG